MQLIGFLSHKNLKYLFWFFFITVCVYFLSTFFLFYVDMKFIDSLPPAVDSDSPTPQKSNENRPYEYYNKISERNLFSVKTDESDKRGMKDLKTEIENLALTSLNLTLIGTVVNEGGESWAIIKDNQYNKEDKYLEGSEINGAKVALILRNKVVLNKDGKDELLVMGIEKIRAEQKKDEKGEGSAGKGAIANYTISKKFISESISNVSQLMAQVRIKPHLKDGKPEGFQISQIKKGSILGNMGFQNEDIIKSINGQEIHSAEDILRVYNTLKDGNFFSMGIVRNNEAVTLNFKVR